MIRTNVLVTYFLTCAIQQENLFKILLLHCGSSKQRLLTEIIIIMWLFFIMFVWMLGAVNCRKVKPSDEAPSPASILATRVSSRSSLQCGEYDLPLKHAATITSEVIIDEGYRQCQWRFQAPSEDMDIRIQCNIFLHNSPRCREAQLMIFDGHKSKRIFCGKKPNIEITSGRGLLIVTAKNRFRKALKHLMGVFECDVETFFKYKDINPKDFLEPVGDCNDYSTVLEEYEE